MKQRFTSLDIRAATNELNEHLAGKYLQNFYSIQQRFMFIKFSSKDILLIEPGMRLHLSNTCGTEISHFCKKMRETCRHAKVNQIYQHGFDRIVVIDILRYRIIVELFSAGNIIILDSSDNIVEILRPVPELGMIKGNKYVWNTVLLDVSYDNFAKLGLSGIFPFEKEFISQAEKELLDLCKPHDAKDPSCSKRVAEYLENTREYLEKLGWYGEVSIQKGRPTQLSSFKASESQNKIYLGKDLLNNVDSLSIQEGQKRSIVLLSKEKISAALASRTGLACFESFNVAAEYALAGNMKAAKPKVDKAEKIKAAQTKYIEELTSQADSTRTTVQSMEEHRDMIVSILAVFKKASSNKLEWKIFDNFYEEEKRRNNPLALAILSYDLKNSTVLLDLDGLVVELNTSLTAGRNIENYYARAKKSEQKAKRTASAMESVRPKAATTAPTVKPQKRTPYWFEKYNFFITTDGILAIGGKNVQDNEYIVKNHLEKNDLYFHCDVHGASSVVCKGRSEIAIQETAYMALCYSRCWEDRVTSQVFYVEPSQVSKTAPSGEYLPRGSFMIAGKKNFVGIHRLEYGVGILFKEEGTGLLEFATNPGEPGALYAMPVAAPWCVVKNYRYRVRLCPSNTKKTQVAKDIMSVFLKMSEGKPEELLVKSIGLDEYMKVVLGKSKISKEI